MNNKSNICYYPGVFAPPVKQHYNAVQWLESRQHISQVIVVIGTDESDQVSQDQKYDLWKIYIDSLQNNKIVLQKTNGNTSMKYIYDKLAKEPESPCLIALDQTTARSKSFMESFDRFPAFEIELIPSQFEDESHKMLDAVHSGDHTGFNKHLPSTLSDKQRSLCFELLKAKELDKSIQEDWLNGTVMEMIQKYKF